MTSPFTRTAFAGNSAGSTGAVSNGAATGGISVDFSAARSEISDATAGRLSLAFLDFAILALVGFYYWTRNHQGGG